MGKFLSLPTLGGRLAILNLLLWIALIPIGRGELLPEQVIVPLLVLVSLPLVTYFLIPSTSTSTSSDNASDEQIALTVAALVINSYLWGYSLSWIWTKVVRRKSDND